MLDFIEYRTNANEENYVQDPAFSSNNYWKQPEELDEDDEDLVQNIIKKK